MWRQPDLKYDAASSGDIQLAALIGPVFITDKPLSKLVIFKLKKTFGVCAVSRGS